MARWCGRAPSILAFCMALAPAPLLGAQGVYEQATLAMRQGNYAEAYCRLRPMAEAGDNRAEYLLGWMYHNGYGLAIDDDKAERWWSRAAEQGNVEALFALGQLHDLDGRTRNDAELALDYYIRAARRGHRDARQILRARLAQGDARGRERLLGLLEGDWAVFGAMLRVKGSKVNIRKGPGTRYGIVATLAEGTPLVELERRGKWVRVGLAGRRRLGWVHAPLVRGAVQ